MRSAEVPPHGHDPKPVTAVGGARLAVVVLAGGESRRFGSDKLAARLDGRSLLDRALDGLPADATVSVVGPERPLTRSVTFLREQPPGGGPAAGLVTGLVWALGTGADLVLTLPGDAPAAGRAAMLLAAVLIGAGSGAAPAASGAVLGVDPSGRDQLLQLALSRPAAHALVDLAGPTGGRDASVRRLVAALDPAPQRQPLPAALAHDIDTVDQLEHLRNLGRA